MTYDCYLGIDPGASGGMAWLVGDHVEAAQCPPTEAAIWQWVSGCLKVAGNVCACVEMVGGYIGERRGTANPAPGSAMFKFGHSYGMVRMALVAAGIPFNVVSPKTWQKAFSLKKTKGESSTSWKNRLKAEAKRLFPKVKVTLATADAILIAEYCRRIHQYAEG